MDSRFFEFDGIKSHEMGVHIVRVDGGRAEVPIWSSASINSTRNTKRVYTDSYRVEREVLSFTFTIYLMDREGNPKAWTPKDISRVSQWLIHDEFKELRFGNDPDKVYYGIVTEASPLSKTHKDGYMEITIETNSPYGWTPEYIHRFECKEAENIIEIEGLHNVSKYYYPEIEIKMLGSDTDIKLINMSDGNRETIVKDLLVNENIYMDGENKEIKSGVPMRVMFVRFNKQWLRLVYGMNRIKVIGKCEILIQTQFPII